MIEKLKEQIPDKVIFELPQVIEKFHINTSLRISHFISQCSHESGGFSITSENLNYSAERLKVVFPKYFTGVLADSYGRKPELIGSRIYANRMGNGDENSKEGYKFRGRGYIQLTGKDNYSAFDKSVPENLLDFPDLVSTKYPLLSAAWFWNKINLNVIADQGSSVDIITQVTKKINGGVNGLADRIEKFTKFYDLLNETHDS